MQAARLDLKDSRRKKEVIAGRANPGEAAATVAEFPQGKAIPLGMVEPAKVLPKPINCPKNQHIRSISTLHCLPKELVFSWASFLV